MFLFVGLSVMEKFCIAAVGKQPTQGCSKPQLAQISCAAITTEKERIHFTSRHRTGPDSISQLVPSSSQQQLRRLLSAAAAVVKVRMRSSHHSLPLLLLCIFQFNQPIFCFSHDR
jgi:hypothetical protein